MTTIFLFDIDLTLVHSGGAGLRAMERTFLTLHGRESAFAGIEFAGRTDDAILRECYVRHALHDRDLPAEFARFRLLYFEALAAELPRSAYRVLPGVVSLLDVLAARDDVLLGLGTGNYRAAAELKLRHGDLWHRFLDGGFADDAEDRAALIATAHRRMRAHANGSAGEVWVVGDSRHDVLAAKANGLRVAGVGTGHSTPASLLAAGADAAFPDLTDSAAFIAATLNSK